MTYLQRVRHQLQALGAEELRGTLMSLARAISPQDREPFLRMLERPEPVEQEQVADLREELAEFKRNVQQGAYRMVGAGARRGLAWYQVLERLLSRAAEVMTVGEPGLAREVYAEALNVLRLPWYQLGEDQEPWTRMRTDVAAIKARYLRLTLEQVVASEGEDARRLADARELMNAFFFASPVGRERLGIRQVLALEHVDLPGLPAFLPFWLLALSRPGAGSSPHRDAVWQGLLEEAWQLAEAHPEVEARLLDLGSADPRLLVEWFKVHAQNKHWTRAMAVAQKGVGQAVDPEARLVMSVALMHLSQRSGQMDLALEGAREAWRLRPSLERFFDLCEVGQPTGAALDTRLVDELEEVESRQVLVEPALVGLMEIAVGDYLTPLDLLASLQPTHWRAHDPRVCLVPPALLLVAAAPGPPTKSIIHDIWSLWSRRYATPLVGGRSWRRAEEEARRLAHHLLPDKKRRPNGVTAGELSSLLLGAVARHPADLEVRRLIVAGVERLVRAVVDDVLRQTERELYSECAQWVAACCEAWQLVGEEERWQMLLTGMQNGYPRHRAFLEALRAICAVSGVLPDRAH